MAVDQNESDKKAEAADERLQRQMDAADKVSAALREARTRRHQ